MLEITPINLDEANAFVAIYHRHHKPMPGCKFCVAVSKDKVVGVAIVGRPVARLLDDGWTLEVNRCCTDGTKNACSMLYSAAWKAAKALGYRRLITYTLPEEGGASLRASNWQCLGLRGGEIGIRNLDRGSILMRYCEVKNFYGKHDMVEGTQ